MDSPSNDDAVTRTDLHRETRESRIIWCLEMESNHRPPCYQHGALTTELPRRGTVARSPGRCQPVNEGPLNPLPLRAAVRDLNPRPPKCAHHAAALPS